MKEEAIYLFRLRHVLFCFFDKRICFLEGCTILKYSSLVFLKSRPVEGGGSERISYEALVANPPKKKQRLSCTPTVNYKHMTGIRPSVFPPAEKEGNKINMASGQQWVLVEMVQAFYEVRTLFF